MSIDESLEDVEEAPTAQTTITSYCSSDVVNEAMHPLIEHGLKPLEQGNHQEEENAPNDKIKLESLFEGLGSFGRFQKIQFILICIPLAFVSMHVMSWTFMVSSARKMCNTTNETLVDDECKELAYSASDRWEMEGENGWIKATVQSVYFIGQLIGSFTCGVMADKIGRKKVLFWCLILQVTCAVLLIIAPTWWIYALLKAGTGFTQPGIYGIAVVLGIELVGKEYRSIISVIANVFCVIGGISLAVMAYFIVDYRFLHAAIAIPSLIFITYYWVIHESARWLVSQEKYDDANVVLCATASWNKKTVPKDWANQLGKNMKNGSTKKNSFGVIDLVRTPQMRKRTLANFVMWPVTTMMYYGLTMRSDVGGGNIFVTFATSQLMELPAVIITALLIDRLGRRKMYSGSIFAAGALLSINWLTHDVIPSECAVIMLMIAKGAVTVSYTVMYTYASELFPTVIRNTAVGCCSTVARFGAITASFIAFFLVDRFGRVVMIVPFTVLAIFASIVAWLMLPETVNKQLPDSISEVEGNKI